MKPIYMIGGSKGGVGKSMVTIALVDYLESIGESVSIIETDTSNPDVFKIFRKEEQFKIELLDLDTADGWIQLVNLCDQYKNDTFVINTAARNNTGVEKYGETLRGTLEELDRELCTLWVINTQKDSLELLRSFLNTFPEALVHVIKNNKFGNPEQFKLYNESNTKKIIEEKKGKSLEFPQLADRVADDLYTKRISIQAALKELPIGNRAELRRWQTICKGMFEEIINV